MTSRLVIVGINHRTAPVETRERVAVPTDALEDVVRSVKSLAGVEEAMMVATCNRVEVYAAASDPDAAAKAILTFFDQRASAAPYAYEHRDEAVVRHAFRVCASLDSLVVGEPQILGQVKEAWGIARDAGCTGTTLNRMMSRAFQCARRVRSETGIANGQVSIASVAVDLARGIFGDLKDRQVVVLGAGKMALGAARGLVRHGARLAIANRSYDKAAAIALEHGGVGHPLTDLPMLLQHGDVIVCSTGAASFVVTRDEVMRAMKGRRGKSLFVIDIAVPRNVDPRVGDLDNVYLYNIDDLERIVSEGTSTRSAATTAAERVIAEELDAFRTEQRSRGAAPAITALRHRFRATAQAELERSLSRSLKHLNPEDRKSLETMLDAMVNKLLHAPTVALRKQADTPEGSEAEETLREMFDLKDEEHTDKAV
jgi:glutamyl-tRNA reductase